MITKQLAKHLREVHFGGNWTSVNLKSLLEDVDHRTATTKIDSLNTIAMLVFHINYYVRAVTKVLEGGPLDAHDKFSFDVPVIDSEKAWEEMRERVFAEAEHFAMLIEKMDDDVLEKTFVDQKYGTYIRNLFGIIEHTHYHLGQISLIKKLIRNSYQ